MKNEPQEFKRRFYIAYLQERKIKYFPSPHPLTTTIGGKEELKKIISKVAECKLGILHQGLQNLN
jgi:hypothetical protein